MRVITAFNKTLTVGQWLGQKECYCGKANALRLRVDRGWKPELALATKLGEQLRDTPSDCWKLVERGFSVPHIAEIVDRPERTVRHWIQTKGVANANTKPKATKTRASS